jgi:hypothetical protein
MADPRAKVMPHYINGKWIACKGTKTYDVMNPATDEVIRQVPVATPEEVEQCVQAAQAEIAHSITENHGKEIAASRASVVRAYQMIESAICVPEWQKGEYMCEVAAGIDEYSMRVPIGVCACIPPFNFPAMVPFWFVQISSPFSPSLIFLSLMDCNDDSRTSLIFNDRINLTVYLSNQSIILLPPPLPPSNWFVSSPSLSQVLPICSCCRLHVYHQEQRADTDFVPADF